MIDLILNDDPIWAPFANTPQMEGYLSTADELFYGGAAGGMKTDLLIGLALTAHRRSIIYRREYPQLESIFTRIEELIDPDQDSWRKTPPSLLTRDKRLLRFGAVQYLKDMKNFQGRPRDFIGFDEITNFHKAQYLFLITWLRTDFPKQFCQVVCTGNPPVDEDGEWVIDYWAPWLDKDHPDYPEEPGKLRWYVILDGQDVEVNGPDDYREYTNRQTGIVKKIYPKSRTFIPARVEDNPVYMKTGYDRQLLALPDELREKMYDGIFTRVSDDNPMQVIPSSWIRLAMGRWTPYKPQFKDKNGNRQYVLQSAVAVDPSRGGNDETVIAKRYDNWVDELVCHQGEITNTGGKVAALTLREHEDDSNIAVDVIGIGSSVYDIIKEQEGINVSPVNFSERSDARDESGKFGFMNKRAEWWWKVREMLDPANGQDIALPPDKQLRQDLASPRYLVTTRGIKIESKDDVKKRIGRSPDRGDAVVLVLNETEDRVGLLV